MSSRRLIEPGPPSDRADRVWHLFNEAVDLSPEARTTFLDRQCPADLRNQVEALLRADRHSADVFRDLDEPPGDDTDRFVNRTVAHFHVLEKLGGGGMGVVYQARDLKLDRVVALKFLPPHLSFNEEAKERFVQEARAVSALDHPNICTIYEISETQEGQLFIAMACYEGETLRQKLARGPLPIGEVVDYATQIARGLHCAHEAGIVHRDVKPANVMITERGQVELLDFGLAKVQDVSLTRTGMALGTVAYMSPEQARGAAIDRRTDVWSLGVVLYEMLTGQRPFRGSPDTIIYAIRHDDPVPVQALRPTVPEALAGVVEKALEKAPAQRYQDVDGLLADLKGEADSSSRSSSGPGRPARGRRPRWMPVAAAVSLLVVAGLAFFVRRAAEGKAETGVRATQVVPEKRTRIVVLPFDNLGPPEEEYFAVGMAEEIISRLTFVDSLGVVSRSSAKQYAGTDKSAPQIGRELGVDYVLDGTVYWVGSTDGSSRMRISPHLTRVADSTEVWANTFDRAIEDVVTIQADIARQVVEQLGVRLGEPEQRRVVHRLTENHDAYHAYLRGKYHASRSDYSLENLNLAVENFARAASLDASFELAYAELARAHAALYHWGYDISVTREDRARQAIEQALALAPASPEVHLALAYYHYWVHRDYVRALRALETAEQGLPDNVEVLTVKAFILRRQGRWEDAIAVFVHALALHPHDARLAAEAGYSHTRLRRYPEALRYLDHSIALSPDQVQAYVWKVHTYWSWNGDIAAARATLESMGDHADNHYVQHAWFWQETYEARHRAALQHLNGITEDWLVTPKLLLEAQGHALTGDGPRARRALENVLRELETQRAARAGDPNFMSSLGVAYAGLGSKEQAIAAGKAALAICPVSSDTFTGPRYVYNLALIYAMLGEHDAAVDQLTYLLSIPSRISIPLLRLDPRWRTLDDHPRFKRLLAAEEAIVSGGGV